MKKRKLTESEKELQKHTIQMVVYEVIAKIVFFIAMIGTAIGKW